MRHRPNFMCGPSLAFADASARKRWIFGSFSSKSAAAGAAAGVAAVVAGAAVATFCVFSALTPSAPSRRARAASSLRSFTSSRSISTETSIGTLTPVITSQFASSCAMPLEALKGVPPHRSTSKRPCDVSSSVAAARILPVSTSPFSPGTKSTQRTFSCAPMIISAVASKALAA